MSKKRWETLRTSLEIAKTERQKHEPAWDWYLQQYSKRDSAGASSLPTDEPDTRIAFATVNMMVASSSVTRPKMYVKPRRKEEVGNAKIVEAFLEQWWQKYRIQKQMVRADRDSKVFGHGWIKTTWNYQERQGRKVEPPPQLVDALMAEHDQVAEAMGMTLTREDVTNYLREKLTQIAVDEPVVQRLSVYDVWVDPQAPDYENLRHITHRYFRRPESVKADEMLARTRYEVEPSAVESNFSGLLPHRSTLAKDGALARVEMWETWDLEEERLYIWSTGGDKLLYDGDWPYAIGHPFTFIPCYEVPEHFYPMGIMELISSKVWEMDEIRGEQLAALRRQRVKWLTKEKYLTDKMRRFLESGQDGMVHGVDDERIPLNEVFFRLDPPPLNPDLFRIGDNLKNDIYEETGVSEYARGHAQTVRSATEVDTINQWGTARVQQMVQNVQDGMVDVARKLVGLAQQNLTQEDVVRLVGQEEYAHYLQLSPKAFPSGKEIVVPFDRNDIAGEFDYQLEAGSANPENVQTRKMDVMSLAQVLISMPEANREEIIRQMVEAFGFVDVESWIIPMQQRMAMQQMGMLPSPTGVSPAAGQRQAPPGTGRPPTRGQERQAAQDGQQGGKMNVSS